MRKLWPQAAKVERQPQGMRRQPLMLSQAPMRVNLVIESLEGLAPQIQARFSVLGLLPGAEVQLLQRRPAPIVRVGETELAIGLELLDKVQVSRL